MAGFLFILLFWAAPIFVAARVCQLRNRNPWKGALLAFFFGCFLSGWVVVAALWFALNRRDEAGYLM